MGQLRQDLDQHLGRALEGVAGWKKWVLGLRIEGMAQTLLSIAVFHLLGLRPAEPMGKEGLCSLPETK